MRIVRGWLGCNVAFIVAELGRDAFHTAPLRCAFREGAAADLQAHVGGAGRAEAQGARLRNLRNVAIARALDIPLEIGETFNGPTAVHDALDTEACDYVMPDLARIGGVTGWIEAAGLKLARLRTI